MMKDSTQYNRNSDIPDPEYFFKQFEEEERKTIERVWDVSEAIHEDEVLPTDEEVEQALSAVHRRIDDKHFFIGQWKWFAAAALVLIVFGAGLFLIPQTERAPYGETAKVVLSDGTEVELNSGSEVQYNLLYGWTNRNLQLKGEAFFDVQQGDQPFIVYANKSAVEVTGTQFNIRAWGEASSGETEVTVTEGSVRFYPSEYPGRSVILTQDQQSRWSVNIEQPTAPKTAQADRILAWRDRKLAFDQQPLSVIFKELERRFDVDIEFKDLNMANDTLSAFYATPEGAESIIKDICRVKGLRYAETANGYRIFK
ncbi:FecR domain-containing protein [Aliifodinibius salicampi]|uniref:FecR domain-containing protein n=1 Tax=Fodinibius salicampi TaxID=1920655 RepID=A0ABT3Q069_9BACT|nr:FecR family protein [Fodinibius salicampi]MCW9713505.1 FecR domain-containing protein [Fodinibius salicampi]